MSLQRPVITPCAATPRRPERTILVIPTPLVYRLVTQRDNLFTVTRFFFQHHPRQRLAPLTIDELVVPARA